MAAEDKDGNRRKGKRDGRGRFTTSDNSRSERIERGIVGAQPTVTQQSGDAFNVTCAQLFSRADGWLRVVPDFDTGRLYVKWKFTLGRHVGHYVMAVSTLWAFDAGLETLLRKLHEVDSGTRRPTHDTYYGDSYGNSPAASERQAARDGDG